MAGKDTQINTYLSTQPDQDGSRGGRDPRRGAHSAAGGVGVGAEAGQLGGSEPSLLAGDPGAGRSKRN